MSTKEATLRLVLEHANDTGDAAEKSLDVSSTISAYTDLTPGRRVALAAAAADQLIAFTDALAVVIVSHDYPFKLRLALGETLLTNLRQFAIFADDEDDGAKATGVYLTGNGANVADLEVWIIEKP